MNHITWACHRLVNLNACPKVGWGCLAWNPIQASKCMPCPQLLICREGCALRRRGAFWRRGVGAQLQGRSRYTVEKSESSEVENGVSVMIVACAAIPYSATSGPKWDVIYIAFSHAEMHCRNSKAQHGAARQGTARHDRAGQSTARHGTAQHGIAPICSAALRTVPHGALRYPAAEYTTARSSARLCGMAARAIGHIISII